MTDKDTENRLGIQWLIKLRWWAVIGQVITIITSTLLFNHSTSIIVVCTILFIEIITNVFLQVQLSSLNQRIVRLVVPLVLLIDIILLTILLHLTGGPMNPFTFLFMVHISLGAILLPHKLSWFITIATISAYGLLFTPHINILVGSDEFTIKSICDINQADMVLHLQGMWGAFAIASCLITFFIGKIQNSFATYHDTLSQLKHEQLNNERLSSLAILAAGAAHELSTPLSTIGVAAGEIVYECKNSTQISDDLKEDAGLIKDQVHRCKDILFQMSAEAGSMQGEPLTQVSIQTVLKQTLNLLPSVKNIEVINRVEKLQFNLPCRSISWAIKGLLKNALDATGVNKQIKLTCYTSATHLCFTVEDNGHGMDKDIILHASDPFFTTKEPGEGMGLGLFLANSICNRFAGSLSFKSIPHEKTTATITFGLDQITP